MRQVVHALQVSAMGAAGQWDVQVYMAVSSTDTGVNQWLWVTFMHVPQHVAPGGLNRFHIVSTILPAGS